MDKVRAATAAFLCGVGMACLATGAAAQTLPPSSQGAATSETLEEVAKPTVPLDNEFQVDFYGSVRLGIDYVDAGTPDDAINGRDYLSRVGVNAKKRIGDGIALVGTIERIALQRSMRAELEETAEQRTAEMREANLHLRDEIERRHRIEKNLRDTHLELTQAAKLASVGQMSAVVSHELNQPLTAIRSNAELAGEYLDRNDIAQTRAKLGAILDMTDRIARLTKRLLNFSRHSRSDAYPVALSVPLDDALGIMEPRMRKEDATFSIEVEPDLLVMGGRNRLSQVFINLIANALDACAGDDVPCHVTVSSQCEGGTVELRFSDNGPGLPDDQQARVFEAFYSTKERGKGLGLGLSVSAKIVSEFGGELLYRPGERGGATFVVALPSLAQKDKAA